MEGFLDICHFSNKLELNEDIAEREMNLMIDAAVQCSPNGRKQSMGLVWVINLIGR